MKSEEWDVIAPDYFNIIESPFGKGVKNPIFGLVRKVGNLKSKSVLELGCGTGTLVPYLAKNFKSVVATDFSKKMVEIASEKHSRYENVTFDVLDMTKIDAVKGKFDVIVAVNSIIMPNIADVNTVLKGIHKKLNPGGVFVAIMPSFDSLIYHAMITYDKEFESRHDKKKAQRATNLQIGASKHNFCYAFFESGGLQKHYYRVELEYRLKLAGFMNFKIGKVHYPWDMMDASFKPKRFKGGIYDELWDWTVFAKKD